MLRRGRVPEHLIPRPDGSGRSPAILIIVGLEFGENIDEFANPPRCQRPARIHHRLVIGHPGQSFREFVDCRTGSDDLGDGNVVDPANGLDDVLLCQTLHGFHPV